MGWRLIIFIFVADRGLLGECFCIFLHSMMLAWCLWRAKRRPDERSNRQLLNVVGGGQTESFSLSQGVVIHVGINTKSLYVQSRDSTPQQLTGSHDRP